MEQQLEGWRARAEYRMQGVKLILQETLLSRRVLAVYPATSEKCISRINRVVWLTMSTQWSLLGHFYSRI